MSAERLVDFLVLPFFLGVGIWAGRHFSEKWARRLLRLDLFSLFPFLGSLIVVWAISLGWWPVTLARIAVPVLMISGFVFVFSFLLGCGLIFCQPLRRLGFFVLITAIPLTILFFCFVRWMPITEQFTMS